MAGIIRKRDSSWIPKGNIVFRSGSNAGGVKRRVGAANRRLGRSRRMVNKTLEPENDVGYVKASTLFRRK